MLSVPEIVHRQLPADNREIIGIPHCNYDNKAGVIVRRWQEGYKD